MKNAVTSFEIWKKIFKTQMNKELNEILSKKFASCYILTVLHVDKWNIAFSIIMPKTLADGFSNKINNNEMLKSTLSSTEEVKIANVNANILTKLVFEIKAKNREELDSMLMYMNLMI